jgi:AraC family ethanolamine operon transcriptional activator
MNYLFDPTLQIQLTCHAPDEFQEQAAGWDIEHLQLAPGNYQISVDIVHTRNLQLSIITHHVGIHERGSICHGTCAVSLPILLDSSPLYCSGGRMEAEDCPAMQSGEEFDTHAAGGVNYVTIVADAALLDQEAVSLIGRPFASLIRSQRVRIGRQDQQHLVQMVSTLMYGLKNSPLSPASWRQELLEKQLIERLILAIRPQDGENLKCPNRRKIARKAEQLIRKHLRQNLNVEQLCSLLGCSVRSLHLGFKERYGITPVKYARTMALNGVSRDLRNLPPTATISDVAMAWGFCHLGRFSQQYRQLFDELPSVTVERGRELTL